MGANNGSITARRYRVADAPPRDFRDAYVKGVRAHALVPLDPKTNNEDKALGWSHLLDLEDVDLEFEKFWIDGDSGGRIGLGLRVDTVRPPAQEVKRLVLERRREEEARRKSALSKAALRSLKEQVVQEIRRRTMPQSKATDMVWNTEPRRLYFFSLSKGPCEAFVDLFTQTFSLELDVEGPSEWAVDIAAKEGLEEALDEVRPTAELLGGFAGLRPDTRTVDPLELVAGRGGSVPDHGFLGREFLTWLIYHADEEVAGGAFADAADQGGPFQVQLGERVVLRGEGEGGGEITAKGPAPAQMADVRYAIAGGLSMREADLLIVRGDRQWQLTLSADLFDIKKARLPDVLSKEDSERLGERLMLLDELDGMLYAAYAAFLRLRLRAEWGAQHLPRVRAWLEHSCLTEAAEAAVHAPPRRAQKKAA